MKLLLFGLALLWGNEQSCQLFLEAIKYSLYIVTTISLATLPFVQTFMKKEEYEDILYIYTTFSYSIQNNFIEYPDLFKVCGALIILSGLLKKRL